MSQGINVDLSAKVTGYEASLRDLQNALSKIDLGSAIGKKLSKAIEQAEAQIKSLNKNLTPRATSNTQIDNIVEKTNLAGEAIQKVSKLMQSVSMQDIDFSKFGSGLTDMQKKLDELKGALGDKVTEGIRQTIIDTEDLSKLFSETLNFDASKATSVEIFEALSKKSKEAAADIAAAQAEIDKVQSDINKQQASQTAKETGLLGTQQSRDQLQDQVREIKAEYEKVFAELRIQMTKGLESLNTSEARRGELLDQFFQGLTPENIKDRISNLYSSLNAEDLVGKKTEFYEKIFGGGRTIDSVIKNINLGDPKPIIEKFNTFVDSIASQIGGDKAVGIKELISKGSIESAANTTIVNLNTAFGRIQKAIQRDKDKIADLLKSLSNFTDQKTEATNMKAVVDTASSALSKKVEELEQSNQALKEQIANQQRQIDAFKTSKVDEIKNTASSAGLNTEQWKIGREEANKYKTAVEQVQAREKLVGKIEGVVQRWFSIYAAVRMVSSAIKSVISTIKELDKTITEIAIVTNMTQDELWGQMSSYTEMARQYASSISGVYKVSQLYYQQGLQTADVMALTEQTLKMARISGLDYAEATNYMTNAVRSFKMEMTEAQRVVDVYSEIAASSATSTAELASAMSKTASSAEAVGSSFENTTAMMAVMIESTRESAENIGSALKSIISRYGEMKTDPSKLIDSEGEEMSLNKVDTALKSVGITLQDTNHQFRDFDDVIFELAGKWDTIDKNTQRYIATVMAGNRQQSRFLALVSSGERLAELSQKAAESEDAATLQVLKTMDSIEAKTQQFKTSLQSLYTDAGIQNLYKSLLDFGNAIVKTFTNFAKEMGTPLAAVAKFGVQFANIANIVTTVFGLIKSKLSIQIKALNGEITANTQAHLAQRTAAEEAAANASLNILLEKVKQSEALTKEETDFIISELQRRKAAENGNLTSGRRAGGISRKAAGLGMAASLAGSALSLGAARTDEKTQPNRTSKAWLTGAGSTLQGVGLGASMGGLWGAIAGGAIGALSGAIEAIGIATESTTEKINNLNEAIDDTNNKKIQAKDDLKTLTDYKKRYEELVKTRYNDEESQAEWIKLNNEIADNYPELISYIDEEGNKIISLGESYEYLVNQKRAAYEESFRNNIESELKALSDFNYLFNDIQQSSLKASGGKTGYSFNEINDATTWVQKALLYAKGAVTEVPSMMFSDNYTGGSGFDSTNGFYRIAGPELSYEFIEGRENQILELAEQANGSLEHFNELFVEKFGMTVQEYQTVLEQQSQTGFLTGSFDDGILYSGQVAATINSFLSQLYTGWDYYTKQALEYIHASFEELVPYYGEKLDLDFTDYTVLNDRIATELTDQWEAFYNEHKDTMSLEQMWQTFYLTLEDRITAINNSLLENISIDEFNPDLKLANDIFTNIDKFSLNYIKSIEDSLINIFSEAQLNELNNKLTQRSATTKARLENILKNSELLNSDEWFSAFELDMHAENLNANFENIAGIYQEQYFNLIQNIIKSSSYLPDLKISTIEGIFDFRQNLIDSSNLTIEQIDELDQILSNADLTSLTGIIDLNKLLSGLDYLEGKIDLSFLSDNILPNLATEFESFTNLIISKSEDFDKALSKASKGMDLKDASEIATKLGINLSDFNYRNGKFFIDDVTKIYEAYIQYNSDLEVALNEEVNNLQNAVKKFNLDDIFGNTTDLINNEWFEEDKFKEAIDFTLNQNNIIHTEEDVNQLAEIYNKYYEAAQAAGQSVEEYIEEQIVQGNEDLAIIRQALEYNTNAALLSAGQFDLFLDKVLTEEDAINGLGTKAQELLSSGNIDELMAMFPEYAEELMKYYKDISKNIYNSIVSGFDNPQYIQADKYNADLLAELESAGLITHVAGEGSEAIYKTIENLDETALEAFAQIITDNENIGQQEKNKYLAAIHTEQYADNLYSAFESVINAYDDFSYEAGQKLATALGNDTTLEQLISENKIGINGKGNLFIQDAEWFQNEMQNLQLQALEEGNLTLYNALAADLEAYQNNLSSTKVIGNLIKNRDSLSEADIEALANMFDTTYDEVRSWLYSNGDGTYRIGIATLKARIDECGDKVGQEYLKYLGQIIDSISDSALDALSITTEGTDDYQKTFDFVNNYNELLHTNKSLEDLFNWDAQTNTWQLSSEAYFNYQQALINMARNAGASDETLAAMLENSTEQLVASVDISGYLQSDRGAKATQDLEKQLTKYYEVIARQETQNLPEYAQKAALDTVQSRVRHTVTALNQGGAVAVEEYRKFIQANEDRDLTAEEVKNAYLGELNQYKDAFAELSEGIQVGTIVTNDALKQILSDSQGFEIDANGVVTAIGDMTEAYHELYLRMQATGEATTSELNAAMASFLEESERDNISAITTLGEAASMSYTRLGEIFASKGIELTEDVLTKYEGIIESLGNGNVRIIDFNRFANEIMGWTDIDTSSEEYISAFKTYNDALIELNRKAEKNIVEEIKSLSDAGQGDQINLTQLVSALNEEADAALAEKLTKLNATLKDGILTLNDGANIPAIIQTLTNEAAKNGLILEDSMAELADTLNDVLQNYTDLISSGISGKLSNTGAQSLQAQAKSLGYIGKLDFRKTANGLKLSDESAYQLYMHLKSVDSLKAGLVFEELADSIISSNANLKTMSGTMATITRTQNKIKSNEAEIAALRANSNNSSRINQLNRENAKLKEQLGLYQQIAQRQMGNPDSYNFMGQELPEIFQGAENYWNSVGNAFKTMNEAGETGTMSIQDFYNITNEMNNLAALSGNTIEFMGKKLNGSAESAAALIQKGFHALSNIDGEGVAIDLSKLGVDFKNGADDMQVGFQEGIQSMAKSQIAMLDAQIQLLETIVAMEKLGEIDSNGNGIFEFIKEELGTLDKEGYIEEFGEGYKKAIASLKKYFTETDNEDLQNAYKNVKICGHTIEELLNASEADLKKWGVKGEVLQKLLQGLWELSQSGDFDPQNIMASITSLLAELGLEDLEFSVDTGDMTVVVNSTGHFEIDWDSASAQAAMEVFGDEIADKHAALQTALDNYIAGKSDATELKAALTYKGIISADVEKPDHTIVDGVSYQNGSPDLEVAIAKAALKDVGATEIKSNYNAEMGTVEATGTIKIGNKKIQVTNDGSKTTYHSTMTGQDYGTVQALRDAEYTYALDQFYKGYRENPGTREQFEAIEYGIPIEFNVTVETNLDTNALREQALEIARQPVEIIKEAIDSKEIDRTVNDDGTITYDFNGIKVTVANKGSLEQQVAAAQQQLVDTVDPDGMITKISAGIQSAFTDDENTIGNAIGNGIVNALKTADFSDKDFEVPEAEATLSKLDITDVESAEMAQNAFLSLFGKKSNTLTLEEAVAKITKLVISGADSTDFSAVENGGETQSNLTIPEATADLTTLKLGEIGEVDLSAVEAKAEAVGENIGEGIITGTENKSEDVTNAGKALGEAAVEGANDGAQTHSPSKATEQTGKDLVAGLVVGMADTSAAVTAAQTLAQTVIQTIQTYFNSNPISISTSMGASSTPTQQTPQTPSVDTSGLTAVQAAIASISAAGQAATTSITTLNANLNNISDNGSAKATDFQAALAKITDVGKTKAENFQSALANIGDNGKQKADDFAAALDAIKQNGINNANSFKDAVNGVQSSGATNAVNFKDAVNNTGSTGALNASSYKNAVNDTGSSGANNASAYRYAVNGTERSGADHATWFKDALNKIDNANLEIKVSVDVSGGGQTKVTGDVGTHSWSWAKGNALAGGKTLMGELGPELVVSNGRYFLVGENGPEMVDLTDDAIVFNHLQTKKLMKHGSVNTHGQPVTNEKKATSMATGSFTGDAFASASETLAYLKQLREMWKSLLGASAKELGALAGKKQGSGKSGGGNDKDSSGTSERSTTADIERWYNLLRQIDKLEQDITYQQQLQSKLTSDRVANGRALYNSYKAELDALDQEIAKSRELATIQKSWYDAKRRELNNSEYSKIFTYDENGLQQYTQGRGRGLDILEHLTRTDANGQPIDDAKTSASQLAYLKKVGFNIDSLLVGSDGAHVAYRGADGKLYDKDNNELTGQELADAQTAMMENFWDNVDGWKDEMDSLYDSYHDQEESILEAEQRRNELLQKLVDNQLSLEQTILKAVEDMKQAEIDNLQSERDAYEDSVNKMIAGLNESLSNERKIYESQEDNTELNKLQRQLALLQRTGGSGASIRSLQEQIESKQQDMYFTERQNEIDAIQEASDHQIERLDEQINIMTETLAYQKENGLLWDKVYEVMQGSPEQIADFITSHAQDWSSKSTLAQEEDLRALKQIIETYTAQRDDLDDPLNEEDSHEWNIFAEANKNRYKSIWQDEKDKAKEIFDQNFQETGDSNQASRAATDYLNTRLRAQTTQPVEPEVEEIELVLGDDDGGSSGSSGGGSSGGDSQQPQQPQPEQQQPETPSLSPKEKAQKYGKQVAAAIWEYPGGSGWGNGGTRKNNIVAKGMDYTTVQSYINEMSNKTRAQRLSMAGLKSVNDLKPYTFAGFKFKNGGLIDYTGPAWVDGSPSKPEYILNAEQTALLRKQLLSSKSSHQNLIGQAVSAADAISGTNSYTTNATTDNSIGISNLNFTMNVAKIADDYDAKKAGEKVMNEMVRIARKNGDRSVSRR